VLQKDALNLVVIMKRILLMLALAMPLLIAQAKDTVIELVLLKTKVESKSLVINLANLQKERSVLRLKSLKDNEVMYNRTINDHNGYCIRLDLSDLPQGRYVLELEQKSGNVNQVVVVNQEGIQVSKITRD
jgi:hypothetical protein